MEPLISIIVLTFNSDKYILETLESVKAQTYNKIELIISDDCSQDQTLKICNRWLEENRRRFVRIKLLTTDINTGIPANCNRGVKESQGEWIKLFAGDDIFATRAIEIFINEISGDKTAEKSVFHGKIKLLQDSSLPAVPLTEWEEPRLQQFNSKEITAKEQFNILLRFCPVSAPTVLLKKTIFNEIGYFDEKFKYWEDRPMWLKITSNGIKFYFIDEDIAIYRRHHESVQVNAGGTLFSRTMLSKDDDSRIIILPYLPPVERFLNSYLIGTRKLFYRLFNNKKTFFINLTYKLLVIPAERLLKNIRKKYSP